MRFWYLSYMPLINTHTDISSKARGLNFGPSLHLHLHFVRSQGPGMSAHMHKLTLAFIAR